MEVLLLVAARYQDNDQPQILLSQIVTNTGSVTGGILPESLEIIFYFDGIPSVRQPRGLIHPGLRLDHFTLLQLDTVVKMYPLVVKHSYGKSPFIVDIPI